MSRPIPQVSYEELIKDVDSDAVREAIQRQADKPDVAGIVKFVNQDMSSSLFGSTSYLAIGPNNSIVCAKDCEGEWLNDLPSQRQYPKACWLKPGVSYDGQPATPPAEPTGR